MTAATAKLNQEQMRSVCPCYATERLFKADASGVSRQKTKARGLM